MLCEECEVRELSVEHSADNIVDIRHESRHAILHLVFIVDIQLLACQLACLLIIVRVVDKPTVGCLCAVDHGLV